MREWLEQAARQFDTDPAARWPTPLDLACRLDPATVRTPALELAARALADTARRRSGRLIMSMAPQEGKSTLVSRRFPLWLLTARRDLRIAVVSYGTAAARTHARAVRDDIHTHRDILGGLAVRPDLAAQTEWQLDGHPGGMYAVGIGGALTGRPVDLLVIDDPLKDRQAAESETVRQAVWDWWTDVGATRLAPGAPVVLVLTRWHEDDLAGRLRAAPDGGTWQALNIPAQADHRPGHGETDVLGRQPGEYMQSARRRTRAEWEAIRLRSPARTWTSLYQGRPAPQTGNVWQRQWWRRYSTPLWSDRPDGSRRVDADDVIMSWDMTFKDTKGSDFVVGQVWARRGADAFLLDQVRARLNFPDTIAEFKRMCTLWPQAAAKLVEDKANGPAVIDSLRHAIAGIVPVTPLGSKYARAEAVAPFIQSGNALLPDPGAALFDVGALVEECAGFPNAANDDQVDAASQALARLLLDGGGAAAWAAYLARRAAKLAAKAADTPPGRDRTPVSPRQPAE